MPKESGKGSRRFTVTIQNRKALLQYDTVARETKNLINQPCSLILYSATKCYASPRSPLSYGCGFLVLAVQCVQHGSLDMLLWPTWSVQLKSSSSFGTGAIGLLKFCLFCILFALSLLPSSVVASVEVLGKVIGVSDLNNVELNLVVRVVQNGSFLGDVEVVSGKMNGSNQLVFESRIDVDRDANFIAMIGGSMQNASGDLVGFVPVQVVTKEDVNDAEKISFNVYGIKAEKDRVKAIEQSFPFLRSESVAWGDANVLVFLLAVELQIESGFYTRFPERSLLYEFALNRMKIASLGEDERSDLLEFWMQSDLFSRGAAQVPLDEIVFKLRLLEIYYRIGENLSLSDSNTLRQAALAKVLQVYNERRFALVEELPKTLEIVKDSDPTVCLELSDMMLQSMISAGDGSVIVNLSSQVRQEAVAGVLKSFVDCAQGIYGRQAGGSKDDLGSGLISFLERIENSARVMARFSAVYRELSARRYYTEPLDAGQLQVATYFKEFAKLRAEARKAKSG